MAVITTKQILGVDRGDFEHPPVDLASVLRQVRGMRHSPGYVDRKTGLPPESVLDRVQREVNRAPKKKMAPVVNVAKNRGPWRDFF